MAIITLTRGYVTIVDEDSYDELDRYNWYASGPQGRPARRLMGGPRKLIYLYHQVLGVLPWVMNEMGLVVDHIDRNPLNNQLVNLRIVSHKLNARNQDKYGYNVGVCFDSRNKKFKAYLDQPDLPRINIGTFLSSEEAYAALEAKKKELGLCE